MNARLNQNTLKVIEDFRKVDPSIAMVIELASEVSYLQGVRDERDRQNEFLLDQKGMCQSEVL